MLLHGRVVRSIGNGERALHFDAQQTVDGAAIAALERLSALGRRLPFPIEVVAFPDEEGLRFQTTYLGSSALAGTFEPELLDRTRSTFASLTSS